MANENSTTIRIRLADKATFDKLRRVQHRGCLDMLAYLIEKELRETRKANRRKAG